MRQAKAAEQRGQTAQAAAIYRQILQRVPTHFAAHAALSRLQAAPAGGSDPLAAIHVLYRQGRLAEAARAADRLVKAGKAPFPVLTALGAARLGLGETGPAQVAFRAALKLAPSNAAAHSNLGTALRAAGKTDAAEAAFAKALALRPDYSEALNNLGLIHRDRGHADAAEAAFARAVAAQPGNAEALTNLGNMQQEAGRPEDAAQTYRKALAVRPDYADAHYNLAAALRKLGRLDEAAKAYAEALRLRPNYAEAENNLANTLKALRRMDGAEAAYRRAVALAPDYAEAWTNLGVLLQERGRSEDAVAAYESALAARPDHAPALAQILYQKAHLCDWSALGAFDAMRDSLGITTDPVPPLTLLAVEDAPARQLARARAYARANYPQPAPRRPAVSAEGRKLRVGYFSADYRSHPVARLFAGALAAHDRDRVALFGYAFGPRTDDALRQEMRGRFDRFTDILDLNDAEAAAAIAEDALDIAVDMTGYTMHSRTALFARRIAPVQINYLGYPGTLGADFIDYIVADPVLVRPEDRPHLSEAVIHLGGSYQPNDNRRPVPPPDGIRADHSLPPDGLVFCCFNSTYKITPAEFDIWMRVLGQIPGSVLWLLGAKSAVEDNLRGAARDRGVDPARLIFADRVSPEAHLARHRHADLFLDTFAYNAHTTASDALWMALPVVTLAGRQFAARVAASLVTAAGLPELIAPDAASYEALILALATDADRRAALRQHLETKRMALPLFDTDRYTRGLEAALRAAHDRAVQGLDPADIHL